MPAALLLTLLAWVAPQNREHPGLVYLPDGTGGTPAKAAEAGMISYRGQWFDKALEKDLRKWEKEDKKEGLDWKDAYPTKSKFYRIRTNVPRYIVELEIKPFLDELFETYKRVFAEDFGLSGKAAGNKDIVIHNGFNDYSVNEPDDGKPRPRSNPGFIVSGSVLVVYYDETDPGTFYMTCFHEGAHQFFLSLLPGASPPHWLNEALATYFEGCTYSRVTKKITPGFVPTERLIQAKGMLQKDKEKTAKEFFMDVPRERFLGLEYSISWSFVYYLIHRESENAREHFARFVQETNGAGAKPADELFAKVTGEDLNALLPGWRSFVLALPTPPEIKWLVLNVTKAGPSEDLHSRDVLWSFDGVEVFSKEQYDGLWKNRPKDRAYEVVVVRCEPDMFSDASTRRFVRVTIQPGSEIVIRPQNAADRQGGLSD
jgi:hypothetical protein